MKIHPTRRRLLQVTAAAAGLALVGDTWRAHATPLVRWRGAALGARAAITLHHPDPGAAQHLLGACLAEVERLEAIFSLYRPDSALSRLNREGRLAVPPLELVEVLAAARRVAALSGGAFDVTVQPLWRLYAAHFGRAGADPAGPAGRLIVEALERVGQQRVVIDPAEIRFERAGMAITLNGIAQGYVTDRVALLLRAAGMERVLVDLGEIRALGGHPDGRPWRVRLADASAPIELEGAAIATSSPAAMAFDGEGRHHHLFDPASGRSAPAVLRATVLAPRATEADALATALAVMPRGAAEAALARSTATHAWLAAEDGHRLRWQR